MTNIAIENHHIYSLVDFPIKNNGGSFHSYVSSPEGISHTRIVMESRESPPPVPQFTPRRDHSKNGKVSTCLEF